MSHCDCPLCTDDDADAMTVDEALELVAAHLACIIRLLDAAGYPAQDNRPLVNVMLGDLLRDYRAIMH